MKQVHYRHEDMARKVNSIWENEIGMTARAWLYKTMCGQWLNEDDLNFWMRPWEPTYPEQQCESCVLLHFQKEAENA